MNSTLGILTNLQYLTLGNTGGAISSTIEKKYQRSDWNGVAMRVLLICLQIFPLVSTLFLDASIPSNLKFSGNLLLLGFGVGKLQDSSSGLRDISNLALNIGNLVSSGFCLILSINHIMMPLGLLLATMNFTSFCLNANNLSKYQVKQQSWL